MARGLRIRPLGDVVVLMPPLAISPSELTQLVAMLRDALHDVLPAKETA
jgi:adenosylmethionine-8-amino-7-oxononanoate aminotransferase